MAKTETTQPTRAPKAPANYAKMADETELIHDGLVARINRVREHLDGLLARVPEREAIMQSFERLANWEAQRYEVKARLDRYVALRDRPVPSNGSDAS